MCTALSRPSTPGCRAFVYVSQLHNTSGCVRLAARSNMPLALSCTCTASSKWRGPARPTSLLAILVVMPVVKLVQSWQELWCKRSVTACCACCAACFFLIPRKGRPTSSSFEKASENWRRKCPIATCWREPETRTRSAPRLSPTRSNGCTGVNESNR